MTRGDIHRITLPAGRGHEQHGSRYAVILQADALLGLSTAIVAPTSTSALPATFRPTITIGDQPTRLLIEQLRTIDLRRLGNHIGTLSADEQRSVDQALEIVLGL
jgi:mRNA interferase MazF